MKTSEQEADDLIIEFSKTSIKISDYSLIEYPTAVLHAKICVNKILSSTGADRAYNHWSAVKEILDNK